MDASRWEIYRREKAELIEKVVEIMKSKKRIQMLKTLVIRKRVIDVLFGHLEGMRRRLAMQLWRLSLARKAQEFFRNVRCRNYNPDIKIRLNKLVIRNITFWTSNVVKDSLEAVAQRTLSCFLHGILRLSQVTQSAKQLHSRVISVQRARRAFAKN
jgi:hypothetical protein